MNRRGFIGGLAAILAMVKSKPSDVSEGLEAKKPSSKKSMEIIPLSGDYSLSFGQKEELHDLGKASKIWVTVYSCPDETIYKWK